MRQYARLLALSLATLPAFIDRADAGDLPATINSSACAVAPTIDGVIDAEEWQAATAIDFDLRPFSLVPPAAGAERNCQLRVMNSANGLYLALRVPDETFNDSVTPFNLDFALLAFCRGKELAAGDDRKLIAPGIYLDKHVTTPGNDADDALQNGRGRLVHREGVYTLEWAVPLGCPDGEDVPAAAGDLLRFNLAYFDGFRADLNGTQVGVAFGRDLNSAADWGRLQLAANVADDGGAAFAGPQWIEPLFAGLKSVPDNRLRLVESSLLPSAGGEVARCLAEYTYFDPRGREVTGRAKLYLPAGVQDAEKKFPLFYSAGYELDDGSALGHVARGCVVVTPSGLEANPLVRTANPDYALLHIARGLPFVDDARTVVGGGSAGGYITLMLAAETFPLAGAAPDVPPVNWGYNAAYFWQFRRRMDGPSDLATRLPVYSVIVPIVEQSLAVYGDDTDQATWYSHSPLAHLPTVTCPVLAYWTTADMLVPIDQIGAEWVRPFDAAAFPAGFTMDPSALMASAEGRLRLFDVLTEDDYELFVISEKDILAPAAGGSTPRSPRELPISRAKQWSVVILDEGPPEPQVGHTKHPVAWAHNDFYESVSTGEIPAAQLTPAKLERLMDRYAGKEWLPSGLRHLDYPESERADVLRGLMLYVSAGAENARTFADFYEKLPTDRQSLEPDVLRQLMASTTANGN